MLISNSELDFPYLQAFVPKFFGSFVQDHSHFLVGRLQQDGIRSMDLQGLEMVAEPPPVIVSVLFFQGAKYRHGIDLEGK